MLTKNQEKYINTIPQEKTVKIVPFDPNVLNIADEVINKINNAIPKARIIYLGSSKLGIAGENDIDLGVLVGDQFENSVLIIKHLFGDTTKIEPEKKMARWEFIYKDFLIDIYLTSSLTPEIQMQMNTQILLESNPNLKNEYEQLKIKSDGLSQREYTKKKLEFFNKILEL